MDVIDNLGGYIAQIPYFPVLHSIHCYAVSASLRSQPGAVEFAHSHPLASLAGNLLIANAGGVLTAAALGTPLIAPFGNAINTLTAVFFWWLVYFGPGDLFFNLYKVKPLQIAIMGVREMRRCKKILDTVTAAAAVANGSWIVLVLVGALGGCSGKFIQATEESMRKHSADVSRSEFLQISFVTKASLMIATVFALVKTDVIPLSVPQALFFCCVVLITINLGMILAGLPDPFHPIANATWRVVSIASKGPAAVKEPAKEPAKKPEDKKKE